MSDTVIADDNHFVGDIESPGDIELKGQLDGQIRCRNLIIGEGARLRGAAAAEKITVRGSVEGTIHGVKVFLTSSARVEGELVCQSLTVDESAYFSGQSKRVEDPFKDSKLLSRTSGSQSAKDKKKDDKLAETKTGRAAAE